MASIYVVLGLTLNSLVLLWLCFEEKIVAALLQTPAVVTTPKDRRPTRTHKCTHFCLTRMHVCTQTHTHACPHALTDTQEEHTCKQGRTYTQK